MKNQKRGKNLDLRGLNLPWGITPWRYLDPDRPPKWKAEIRRVGKKKARSLGFFPTMEEALEAKENAIESFSWLEDRPWE